MYSVEKKTLIIILKFLLFVSPKVICSLKKHLRTINYMYKIDSITKLRKRNYQILAIKYEINQVTKPATINIIINAPSSIFLLNSFESGVLTGRSLLK